MHSKQNIIKRIALERMERLFYLATGMEKEDGEEGRRLARRYTELLKKISTHYKIPMPKSMKNRICSGCGSVLMPGLNCSVRVASSKGYVAYACECGREKHIFYKGS